MKSLTVFIGLLLAFNVSARYPWPITNYKLGHILSSYQKYDGSPYFHHAIDIVAEKRAKVFVSAPGKVKRVDFYGNGDDELYFEVVIQDDDGNIWKYHHLDEWYISNEIRNAYYRGTRVESGTYIGKLVYWPFKMKGKPFHHLHLDVLDKNKNYLNPLNLLDPIIDNHPPEIIKMGVLKKDGDYTIYAKVKDIIDNTDFFHPPKKVEISVDNGPVRVVWDFDQLPGGKDKRKFIKDFYIDEMTQGNYKGRKYVINLGFDKEKRFSFPRSAGEHTVMVKLYDYAGNTTEKNFTWEVK